MADPENGLMNGEHLDEGVVHAWLDGQLTAADAARIESHIAGCADCAAMVAEARGFMAASSRILTGLDGVPARVVPRSRSRARIWQVRAAAAVIVVAVGAVAVLSDPGGRLAQLRRETAVPQPALWHLRFPREQGPRTRDRRRRPRHRPPRRLRRSPSAPRRPHQCHNMTSHTRANHKTTGRRRNGTTRRKWRSTSEMRSRGRAPCRRAPCRSPRNRSRRMPCARPWMRPRL